LALVGRDAVVLPELFTASHTRPVPLRLRPDLLAQPQRCEGREGWVLKDPLRLKYFRFEAEEFQLLRLFDGTRSLAEVQEAFETQFAPRKIEIAEIYRLLGQAHRSGLLLSDAAGQGQQLLTRHAAERQKQRWMGWTQLLNLRWRGVDPDRWLARVVPYVGWIFSWPLVLLGLLCGSAAGLLVISQWETFSARLPAAQEFFGPSNWGWLAITLATVKILHELGHAFACKRFGSECHSLGLLFLCFTPCLYCDVSDAWMLPNKWKRMAISAAGMYIELWLASGATFVWWFSEPSLVQHLALNVMFIGSVGTLLFNADPLMRYDGYYILSDLLEIPNLSQQASQWVQRAVRGFFFGGTTPPARMISRQRKALLICYAVASAVYRWGMTAGILWFLYRLTDPYGFKIVGQLLAAGSLAALIGRPLWATYQFLSQAGSNGAMEWNRFWLRGACLLALVVLLGFVPLPYYLRCAVHIQPQDAAGVFVNVPGQIAEVMVAPGDAVQAGQPIMRLNNSALQLAITKLQSTRETEAARLLQLRQLSLADAQANSQIAQVEQSLRAIEEELTQRRKQESQLVITAPRAGIVLPALRKPPPQREENVLATWHGHLLEQRNRGARIEASELICWIGDARLWNAVIAVDQRDVEWVHAGQRVDLLLTQQPGQRIASEIASVAKRDMKYAAASLSHHAGGELLTQADAQGRERPLSATYEALTRFESTPALLATGGGGIARVHAGQLSLAARVLRAAQHVFHWEL
jgi:putative peptide zinc metalloprotease protein